MRVLGIALLSIFAFLGCLFCGLIAFGVYSVASFTGSEPPLPEKMVLSLTVGESFREDPAPDFYTAYAHAVLGQEETPPLLQVVEAIDRAATDPAVTGLLVRIQPGTLGMAQAQEVRAAIERFRLSGKKTFAFAETFGESGNGTIPYYVASAAEEIWLQPSGLVGTTGFALRQPYLRGLLDKWGVTPEFEKRKAFKGAASPLTDYGQSDAQAQALQAVVDGWLSQVVSGVARSRSLSEAEVRTLIDASPLLAPVAVESGLVTYTGYRDHLFAAIGLTFKDERSQMPRIVPLARYVGAYRAPPAAKGTREIVYINASGTVDIGNGRMVSDGRTIDALALSRAIEETVTDSNVAAIILRIDSPGGSYVGSDVIWRSVEQAREKGMPVIASFGDTAASGGYFMVMGANRIIARPGTLTGSIGVIAGKINVQKLSADNDVTWEGVDAGRNAAMYSLSEPFSDTGRERLSTILDTIYEDFTTKAAAGRGLSAEEVEAAAQGRVWTGEDARRVGLVDELGGLPEAIAAARREAGLAAETPTRLVVYEPKRPPLVFFRVLARQMKQARSLLSTWETVEPAVRDWVPAGRTVGAPGAVDLLYTGPSIP